MIIYGKLGKPSLIGTAVITSIIVLHVHWGSLGNDKLNILTNETESSSLLRVIVNK